MLRNYRAILALLLISIFTCTTSLCAAQEEPAAAGKSGRIDMGSLFVKGTLGCLYGMLTIGGVNTVIILMGENTKGNFYRTRYGFAVGAIVGLIYGTAMGLTGNDLIPKPNAGGGTPEPAAPPAASNLHKRVLYALSNLTLEHSEDEFKISTKLLNITF